MDIEDFASSFSYSPLNLTSLCQETPDTLQRRLQCIVQSRPENWWVYSILWQPSQDEDGLPVLSWGDGHFRDSCKTNTATNNDLEWFYTFSVTRKFGSGDGAVGRVFTSGDSIWLTVDQGLSWFHCDRVKEARMHGVHTLVFVPTSCGVVELGSAQLIKQDHDTLQLAKSLFQPDVARSGVFTISNSNQTTKPGCGQIRLLGAGLSAEKQLDEDIKKAVSSDSDGNFTPRRSNRGVRSKKRERDSPQNHVEAERQRREKLNRRFYALRAAVPNVSKMDKASLLDDAVHYINELKSRVQELETKHQEEKPKISSDYQSKSNSSVVDYIRPSSGFISQCLNNYVTDVDVKIMGSEAMIRVRCPDKNYPAAKLMDVLRDLEFSVYHASVTSVRDLVLQDVVVRLAGDAFITEDALRTAIFQKMHC